MNRRRFLQTTAAAAVMHKCIQAAPPATRMIDTHTHFYDPLRPGGVPWPSKGSKLYRTVLPADWLAVATPLGVKETVIVEASPLVEDNQWILDLAAKEKCIVGFVRHLDPGDKFAANLKRFSANPIFRGVRWSGAFLQDEANHAAMLAGAKYLAEYDLELDLNGSPAYLPHAAKLAAEVPDLRILINHLGASGDPQALKPEWKDNIRTVAKQPNIFMKVSALVEQVKCEAGKAPSDTDYYLPILEHLWRSFGPDRLIYGSNWPVSDKGAPYDVVFKIVDEFFRSKGSEACEKYFWKNSLKAYRWVERT